MIFAYNQRGLALLESILAISLVGIVILSHARAQILNQEIYNRNRRNSLAMQQAEDLMEQFSSYKLDDLSDSNNLTQSGYLYNGIRFDRSVSVDVNGDASISISVTVSSSTAGHSGSASLSKTFAFVGSR